MQTPEIFFSPHYSNSEAIKTFIAGWAISNANTTQQGSTWFPALGRRGPSNQTHTKRLLYALVFFFFLLFDTSTSKNKQQRIINIFSSSALQAQEHPVVQDQRHSTWEGGDFWPHLSDFPSQSVTQWDLPVPGPERLRTCRRSLHPASVRWVTLASR